MILIKRNQQTEVISKKQNKKTQKEVHVFNCPCGTQILIDPDLKAMNEAIKNHIVEHKKLTGQCLTEDILREDILKVVVKAINET